MNISVVDIINNLAESGRVVIDDFLGSDQTRKIFTHAQDLNREAHFTRAGVGTAHLHTVNKQVRGDSVFWIDPDSGNSAIQSYIEKMRNLIEGLNRGAFLGIKDIEMHYACYPVGAHYEKHIDQLQVNGKRVLSAVFYLNADWQPGDGGELRIYDEDGQSYEDITPQAGRLVLFLSNSVYHEVLPVNKERYSITGWMLNQYTDTTFVGITAKV